MDPIIVTILVFALSCVTAYDLSVSPSEYNALYDLFNSTDGYQWHWDAYTVGIPWDFANSSSDPCKSHWQGLQCGCVSVNSCTIKTINLSSHSLMGTLPLSIYEFVNLTSLMLYHNSLSGPLPETIGNLHLLSEIDVGYNVFTSSIPESFYELTNLTIADFGYNYFSGTLSPKWANFQHLQKLSLSWNVFYGNLTNILRPDSLNVHSLKYFVASGNLLTGSIPESVGEYQNLEIFVIAENDFTGTLPAGLSQLRNVTVFDISANFFHGNGNNVSRITSSYSQLVWLSVDYNQFSGSIPVDSAWVQLMYYYINDNYFVGSIPNDFSRFTTFLTVFYVSSNSLTGTLPGWIAQMSKLDTLRMSYNFLHGNLYSGFPNSLSLLSLRQNEFTGSIPDSLFIAKRDLHYLGLNNNRFTGTVSNQFANLPQLVDLFLFNNRFSGTIPDNFISSNLLYLDISTNSFTGTIPNLFSQNQSLNIFQASSNCFHGPVPEQICLAKSLQFIELNGLASGTACRKAIFPGSPIFTAFVLELKIGGQIPSCLFTLPNLTSLQLSGNGFSGNIPSDWLNSTVLNDLDLSHNKLSGSIPSDIQENSWFNLDLSYNELNGLLLSSFSIYSSPETSLTLKVNRLSGSVPKVLLDAVNINILDGNIFECDLNPENLPTNDPKSDMYSCGSDLANTSMVYWASFLLSFLALACLTRIGWDRILGSFPEGTWCHEFLLCLGQLSVYQKDLNHKCQKANHMNNHESARSVTFSLELIISPLMAFLQRKRSVSPSVDNEKCPESNTPEKSTKVESLPELLSNRGFKTYSDDPLSNSNHSADDPLSNSNHSDKSFGKKKKVKKGVVMLWLFNQQIRTLFLTYTAIALVILMPIFSGISVIYQTYRYTYAYEVGCLYLTGDAAGIIMFVVLFLFLVLVIIVYQIIWYPILSNKSDYFGSVSRTDLRNLKNADILLQQWKLLTCGLAYSIVGIINGFVMVASDMLYVYGVLNLSSREITVIELLLALVKIYFNTYFMWDLLPTIKKRLLYRFSSLEEKVIFGEIDFRHYSSGDISFMSVTFALNNLFYPALAILFISPNCFYNALIASQPVSSSYLYEDCSFSLGPRCLSEEEFYTVSTYNPPFEYSYSCSSTIFTYYIPVFIFMFLLESILLPAGQFVIWFIYDVLSRKKKEQQQQQATGKRMSQTAEKRFREEGDVELRISHQEVLPTTTRQSSNDGDDNQASQHVETEMVPAMSSLHESPDSLESQQRQWWSDRLHRVLTWCLPFPLRELTPAPPSKKRSIILFNKTRYVVKMNAYLAILITYGSVYPPLAFIICCSIYLISWKEEIIVGRLLFEADRLKYVWYEKQLFLDCMGIMNPTRYTLALVIPVASALFACLIFDVLEPDSNGLAIVFVFIGASVLTLIAAQMVFNYIVRRASGSRLRSNTSGSSEDTVNELWNRNGIPHEKEGAEDTNCKWKDNA
jgi:Leucine-rich repeat (LRR) protein/uncharacterized membrane protein